MEIETLISNQNPQWINEGYLPPESNWPNREVLTTIEMWLDKRFIIALTGIRRIGKSTLLKQIISHLIKQNLRQRTLYFSFERIQLKLEPLLLEKIIQFYLENVLGEKIYEIKVKVFLFFDEIQNVPDWQDVIKSFYDQNQNVKFFVSGSQSLFIKKRSKESLAGRIIEIKMYPLSFSEYLKLNSPGFLVQPKNRIWVSANIGILNNYFEKYLKMGQFPEIITQKMNLEQAGIYLETVEEKITQQDLPKIFPIKHPEILNLILNQIKVFPGQRIEYSEFAQNAGLNQRTISKYFDYLEKGFLIFLCRNFGKKPLKSLKVARKGYLVSPNLSGQATMPLLVENYVFNFFNNHGYSVYFQKEKEIDFVAENKKGGITLAEVKYQNEINTKDSKNLKDFLSQKKAVAYLITKKYLHPDKLVSFIPASLVEFYL